MTQANIRISAEDKTAAAFASVSRQFDRLGFNADTLKGSITGALGALAVPVSAGAIAALVMESAKAIDQFNDLKDATGSSIENISALDRIARETGGTFEDVSGILVKFNKVLAEAEPDKGPGAILKAMNLDIEELKRLDPAEALRRTAAAMAKYADDGAKGRYIQELFGKSVREAAPFLKDLAEQTALHATTSTQAAEEAEKFNKELYRLKANAQDFARSLTVDVITALNKTIAAFREGQKAGEDYVLILSRLANTGPRVPSLLQGLPGARLYGIYQQAGEALSTPATGPTAGDFARMDRQRPLPSIAVPPDPGKKTGGGAPKDPYAEAKRYLENLQRQLEKTRDLGLEEQALAEIQSGRMGKVNPALEKQILSTARLIDLNKAEADSLKAMEKAAKDAADAAGKLVDEADRMAQEVETPYEKLQRQLEALRRSSENNPLISAETSARMGTRYWQEYLKSLEDVNKQTDQFDLFTKNAAENIQGYLGESFQQLMEGNFDNIGSSFTRMINRMVAEALAADLARKMFGSQVQGGSGDGVLGSLISAGASFFFGGGGFDMYGGASGAANSAIMSGVNAGAFGGVSGADTVTDALFRKLPSYDVGTDFVPYDQVALVHRGERIVPAAENKPGFGGNTFHLSVSVSPPPNTSRSSATQWGSEAARQMQHALSRVGG